MEMSVDTLEQMVLADEAAIARRRARQAVALAALDRAQVHAVDGARTMTEWVAGRFDVAPETAKDLLDAARLVADQPERAAALGGDTFDRVLATARLAATGASEDQVEASRGFDIAGVRRLAALHRRITRRDEHQAFQSRYLVFQPSLDGTTCTLRGELPGDRAEATRRHLAAHADTYPTPPDGIRPSHAARMADALCDLTTTPTSGTGEEPVPVVTFTVDATTADATAGEAGAEVTGSSRIGPETLHKLLCGGRIEVNVTHPDGTLSAAGPISRCVTPRLRRAVIARDRGRCAIGGCNSRHRLQVHHLHPQAAGGTHDPQNLVTLCWFHHQVVVHGYGYRIDPQSPPQRRRLIPPPGQRIPTRSPP